MEGGFWLACFPWDEKKNGAVPEIASMRQEE
jgi:hypothetical protein